jgi:hypothetical protein
MEKYASDLNFSSALPEGFLNSLPKPTFIDWGFGGEAPDGCVPRIDKRSLEIRGKNNDNQR